MVGWMMPSGARSTFDRVQVAPPSALSKTQEDQSCSS
jgi:hypothetical protein